MITKVLFSTWPECLEWFILLKKSVKQRTLNIKCHKKETSKKQKSKFMSRVLSTVSANNNIFIPCLTFNVFPYMQNNVCHHLSTHRQPQMNPNHVESGMY